MSEVVLKVDNASFRYPNAKEYSLQNISFEVKKGDFIAVMGENGAGKTTLCKLLCGIIPHSQEGMLWGDVFLAGENTKEHKLSYLCKQVGIVLDDPESQIFTTEVQDEVAFAAENLEMPVEEIRRNVQWAIHTVRMDGYEKNDPTRLSGGQKQRVSIAAAIATVPSVLILDEPTSQLDPIGTVEVFEVIRELKEKHNITIVMVTHKSEEIVRFADKVLVLHKGEVLAMDTPQAIFTNKEITDKAWLAIPQVTEVFDKLSERGLYEGCSPLTVEDGKGAFEALLQEKGGAV